MKTLKKIWVHFEYWITFLIIPFWVILIKVFSFFFLIYLEIKEEIMEQWSRYLKYIELSK